MERIEREVVIPAPPEAVWPALTEGDEVSRWFGAEAELDARPGGRGVFRWPDGTERPVLVEEVEPPRRLAFRWLPFQRDAVEGVVPLPSTRVEITLHPVPGGTRVRVVEAPAFTLSAARTRAAGGLLAAIGS